MFKRGASKKAFTLAEVLITLGIIGIIAEITIPVLMQNVQDLQFKAAAKSAYSNASQALQLMKNDNGGSLTSYYTTAGSFKPSFMQYFKVVQDCNLNDCVPPTSTSTIYSNFNGYPGGTWIMDNGQFITTDGMFWGINNEGISEGLEIAVDVNGYQKKPNKYGRDLFMFQVLNDVVVPSGAPGTDFAPQPTYNYCNSGGAHLYMGLGCMQYLMTSKDY